jgi:hypothetical protein
MATRPYRQPLSSTRSQRGFSLRLGAVFACLALLSQLLVSTLPMRAGNAAPWSICSAVAASKTSHVPGHAPRRDDQPCPVCTAIHLAGITLPVATVAHAVREPAVWFATAAAETPASRQAWFRPQQARGPPVPGARILT